MNADLESGTSAEQYQEYLEAAAIDREFYQERREGSSARKVDPAPEAPNRRGAGRGPMRSGVASAGVRIATAVASGNSPTSDLSPASPIGALIAVAESAEEGLTQPADIEDRMDRFPELRDVEVATGNAARFPELAEPPMPAAPQEPEQDEGYRR